MIVLVGATGTIGRHLVQELKQTRSAVRVLTRDPERASRLLGDAEFVAGDPLKAEHLAKVFAGASAAFLLSPLDPDLVARAALAARAARKAGAARVVWVSARGADPKSDGSIPRWHGRAEAEIRAELPDATVLRPTAFDQNFLGDAAAVRRGVLPNPFGAARVGRIDARDVAAVAAAALRGDALKGRTLELTGPTALAGADAAAVFARVLRRPVFDAPIEPAAWGRELLASGAPAWLADALSDLAARIRAGGAERVTDHAREATGREPLDLERFVRDHAAAFA